MAIVLDRDTGRRIKIDPDLVRYYRKEISEGVMDAPKLDKPIQEPAWTRKYVEPEGEPISKGQMDPVDRALGILEGVSYELWVEGKRRRSGIILGFDRRSPDLRNVRVVTLEDREATGVKETAYPLDLVLSRERGSLSMKLHLPGYDGVFAKGRLIQASRN